MEHLLAMILTAFDPRVNPAAKLLWCQASQTCDSVVKLFRSRAEPADAGYYTINPGEVEREYGGRERKVMLPSGQIVSVRAWIQG